MQIRSRWDTKGRVVAVSLVAALAVAGVAAWNVTSAGTNGEVSMTNQGGSAVAPDVATSDLAIVSRARVFFGHQSVGKNVLDGVRAVYEAHGKTAPIIEPDGTRPGGETGFIDHGLIGENKKPLLKIQDFDAKLRSGLGQSVDVAMMKFCYVDVNSDTNVEELFAAYRKSMADLQRDFPHITFVHATVSLQTDQGSLSKLKRWVTGNSRSNAADNVARERLNVLIRNEYAGTDLFDLAAVESTLPNGSRAVGTYEGQQYYRLYEGYASDSGHLNGEGAKVAGAAWLTAVARAAAK